MKYQYVNFLLITNLLYSMVNDPKNALFFADSKNTLGLLEINFIDIKNRSGDSLEEFMHYYHTPEKSLILASIWVLNENGKEIEFYEAGSFNRYLFTPSNQLPSYEDFEIIPELTPTKKRMIKNTLTYWQCIDEKNKKIVYLASIRGISQNCLKKQYISLLFKCNYGSDAQKEEAVCSFAQLYFSGDSYYVKKNIKMSQSYFQWLLKNAKNSYYKEIAQISLEQISNILKKTSSPEESQS